MDKKLRLEIPKSVRVPGTGRLTFPVTIVDNEFAGWRRHCLVVQSSGASGEGEVGGASPSVFSDHGRAQIWIDGDIFGVLSLQIELCDTEYGTEVFTECRLQLNQHIANDVKVDASGQQVSGDGILYQPIEIEILSAKVLRTVEGFITTELPLIQRATPSEPPVDKQTAGEPTAPNAGPLRRPDEVDTATLQRRFLAVMLVLGLAVTGALISMIRGSRSGPRDEAWAESMHFRKSSEQSGEEATSHPLASDASDEEAFQHYEQLCHAGNASACVEVGHMFRLAVGTAQHLGKAADYYEKACEGGAARGCTGLGVRFFQREGRDKDEAKAFRYFQQGCHGGDLAGCANLGLAYSQGKGVSANLSMARFYYSKACDDGHARACGNLGHVHQKEGQLIKAARHYRLGCDLGDRNSCHNLEVVCANQSFSDCP